jgi:Winged helix-turn-helix DNA-binding
MEIDALNDHELGDSMLEEIRRTAERRLHEIEPLLEEAERLRDILDVIEGRFLEQSGTTLDKELATEQQLARSGSGTSRLRKPRQRRRAQPPRPRSRSGERAAKGSNKRAILALVADKPGITAAEISAMTGMKRTVVASTVSRLKRYGELIEHETGGVCVPSAPRASTEASSIATVPSRTSTRSRRQPLTAVQSRRAA